MEDTVDVKALRARFSSSATASHTSSRDSHSPKSPQSDFVRATGSTVQKDTSRPKVSPTYVTGPDAAKFQRNQATAAPAPAGSIFFPPSPLNRKVATLVESPGGDKVKQAGEMLEKMMLRRAAGPKVPLPVSTLTPPPLRLKSTSTVIPLRKPLPSEGPLPVKPKRPPNVDLEQFLKMRRQARPLPVHHSEGLPNAGSKARQVNVPGVTSPLNPPSRLMKPDKSQNDLDYVDVDIHDDSYDDIATFEDKDDYDDSYLSTEDFPPQPPSPPTISIDPNKEKELRKKFKYEGPLRVLQTLMVDGVTKKPGVKDLYVSHGDVLDVIQFTNSKKALCHNSTSGKYGYVSRKLLVPLEGNIYDDVHYHAEQHDDGHVPADY
ncbi:PML-RARA-regulated adapter molecule 1 [Syngnathus scovelli]|uniref:PML-RARA-regulated adapter molecule 1 n=1 Tax=Syngnathus scovelli TaxID=161590 RepID=UPI00210F2F40|nr:PML-RARA-regulated adapter molecule 1 [Syngnathus scovelli]